MRSRVMRPGETLLEMARRHVREGEAHVAGQRAIVARLGAHGLPTGDAEALLAEFESTLRDHQTSLMRMLEEQRLGLRDEAGDRIFPAGPLDRR